jgi:hypothetical protein
VGERVEAKEHHEVQIAVGVLKWPMEGQLGLMCEVEGRKRLVV